MYLWCMCLSLPLDDLHLPSLPLSHSPGIVTLWGSVSPSKVCMRSSPACPQRHLWCPYLHEWMATQELSKQEPCKLILDHFPKFPTVSSSQVLLGIPPNYLPRDLISIAHLGSLPITWVSEKSFCSHTLQPLPPLSHSSAAGVTILNLSLVVAMCLLKVLTRFPVAPPANCLMSLWSSWWPPSSPAACLIAFLFCVLLQPHWTFPLTQHHWFAGAEQLVT